MTHALNQISDAALVQGPLWLQELRQKGFHRFEKLGLPHQKMESWKYTSVKPITDIPFSLGTFSADQARALDQLPCAGFDKRQGIQISFLNGHFAPSLSGWDSLPKGVKLQSLAQAIENHPELVQSYLDQAKERSQEPFAALNTAYVNDGVFLHVPEGVKIEETIEIFYFSVANGSPTVSHPRSLIVLETGAEAKIVETCAGKRSNNPYFTNVVTEVFLKPQAILKHFKIQDECEQSFHLGHLSVNQEKDSSFATTNISIGSRLSRQDIYSKLDAPGADCEINGLYMVHGSQHVDFQTQIDHAKPYGTSRELFKGILDDQSHGVFNGQIMVREGAHQTNSCLTNNNLLLSKDAVIDTKPLLEIFNDDVKCTHGATIGRLDPNQIFYLRSRGIEDELARHLLTYAFASEIVHQFKVSRLRTHIEEVLLNRLKIRELSVEGEGS